MGRSSTIEISKPLWRAARANTAVGYCRRSTDRQEQSIPDQRKALELYAQKHNLKLLRFYIDDAISGTSTVGRKAFKQLIDDAKRNDCDFGLVLVYDVKRFGRIDNDEAGHYRYILKTHGVDVRYCSENFTGDRTDDLLRPVKQWQAREESKDLSKVTIRGLLSKAGLNGSVVSEFNGRRLASGEGWWMGGAPPYGYDLRYESSSGEFLFYLRYMRDGTKQMFDKKWKIIRTLARRESVAVSRKDRCKLVPSATDRVKLIQRIFDLYVGGRGFKSIVDLLNREEVPTPRGPQWSESYGGHWTITSVRNILINPAYGGDLVWNRRTDARFHRIVQGEAVVRKDVYGRHMEWNKEEDWIVIPDAHEPLVKRRIWEQARQLLRNKPDSERQRGVNQRTGQVVNPLEQARNALHWTGPRAKFLLSGLIVCPRCGSRYEGRIDYGARPKSEREQRGKRFVYGCGGYIRHGKSHCSLGAVRQDVLEEAVIQSLLEFYQDLRGRGGHARIAKLINEQIGATHQQVKAKRKALAAQLKHTEKTIRNLVDNITAENRDFVDKRLAELRHEHSHLQEAITSTELMEITSKDLDAVAAETGAFLDKLDASLRDGDMDHRQAGVRRCLKQIEFQSELHQAKLCVRSVPTIVSDLVIVEQTTIVVRISDKRHSAEVNC